MQFRTVEKVTPTYRIAGSVLLYRLAARTQPKGEKSPLPKEPWWNVVLGVPLLVRTLFRLVFVCRHAHKGPPITIRETSPRSQARGQSVFGPETYVTCLDCGQKFAYDHKRKRMEDYWGVHDAKALAGVRQSISGWFSPVPGLFAWFGKLGSRVLADGLAKPAKRVASGLTGRLAKPVKLAASASTGNWFKSIKTEYAKKLRPRHMIEYSIERSGGKVTHVFKHL
jgi:hypothetical protein